MFEERVAELEALARELGLDFFPTSFEVVPQDIMTEIAAYGLPTRARHWSYGKVYQQQHLYGTMGLSKVYEIVLNSNPALAFSHSIGFRGRRIASYGEGRSTLDFPLIHDTQS